jgi:hypothetical protein
MGRQKPDLPHVHIPCALSTGETRTILDGNRLMRDEGTEVGTCLGAESAEEMGASLGIESVKEVGAGLRAESAEELGACLGAEVIGQGTPA